MVLVLLLARAGVSVTVLEKHEDFRRDFRGDTVHPPTLRLLDDLGLGEAFARLPAGRMSRMRMRIGSREVTTGDLALSPGRYRYFAMVPQWDLLDLLAQEARRLAGFTLRTSCEAVGLIHAAGRVTGVRYRDDHGEHEIVASLVVGCDGRWSVVRREAGLELAESRLPMDVWWMRVPMRQGEEASQVTARFVDWHAAVSMARHDYHQVAYLIPKGSDRQRRQTDIRELRQALRALFGWDEDQVEAVRGWDDVKFLDARAGMLRRWSAPGVLCIGDAAHPMSPVMGVGVNLAIQDAVATARILAPPLRAGTPFDAHLARIERRRRWVTRVVRAMQDQEHDRLVRPALQGRIDDQPLPGFVMALQLWPRMSGIATWIQTSLLGREPTPSWAKRQTQPPVAA